jgi:DNA-binding beta-propeller fold protein YncE
MRPNSIISPGKPSGDQRRRYWFTLGVIMASATMLTMAAPASAQAATSGFGIITNIPLGIAARAVTVDPATNMIYVAGSHTIAVVNGKTNTVVTTIQAGSKLFDITADPATNTIYALDFVTATLFVISGQTNTVTATVPLAPGRQATSVTCDPTTDMIYATTGNGLVAVNGKTNKVVTTITGAGMGGAVAADPATGLIYALSSFNMIAAVSEQTNTVVNSFTTPVGVAGLAVNPATDTLYASLGGNVGHGVAVFNGQTGALIAQVKLIGRPSGVAANPVTGAAYVANRARFEVAKISAANKVVGSAALPGRSFGVAVDPNTNTVYATDQSTQELTVLHG